ncbi:MAG TPA: hypothetical protein EYP10_00945, partial [Armatimonadetes bacterium]|nr:hypothetical protein [Armatimonadota bacterium]
MQVGFGCVDVTPPIGAIIPGYMHQRHAKGVHDPLLVTAVTFANDEVTLALVSVDALSIKSSTVAQARERAQELCGIPASNILIATTHTHNGGPTANAFLCDADEAYCDWLAKQIASAVAIAYEKRVDADIGM